MTHSRGTLRLAAISASFCQAAATIWQKLTRLDQLAVTEQLVALSSKLKARKVAPLAVPLPTIWDARRFTWDPMHTCNTAVCDECCLRSSTLAGQRRSRFWNRVQSNSSKPLRVLSIGNSVSRWNKSFVSRRLVDSIRRVAPEGAPIASLNQTHVIGGISAQHEYFCGRNRNLDKAGRPIASDQIERLHDDADLVLVHFHTSLSMHSGLTISSVGNPAVQFEKTIRSLLQLPSSPLVVMVSHCIVRDIDCMSTRLDSGVRCVYVVEKINGNVLNRSTAAFEPSVRRFERTMAAHYGLTFVDTCAAMRHALKRSKVTCPIARKRASLFATEDELLDWAFADNMHLTHAGLSLQACAVAYATFAAPQAYGEEYALPEPLTYSRGALGGEKPVFCAMAGQAPLALLPGIRRRGWRVRTGGAGSSKKWLFSNATGATLHMRTPKACTSILLELYMHHDLPLGTISVTIDDVLVGTVDLCCPAPGCVGVPVGQGIYQTIRVPSSGQLTSTVHKVVLRNAPRPAGQASPCAKLGKEVSVLAFIGMSGE